MSGLLLFPSFSVRRSDSFRIQVAGVTVLLELALFFSPSPSTLLAASTAGHRQATASRPRRNQSKTVPPKSEEASSKRPQLKLNLKSLDLTKSPIEVNLRMVGQLGG